MVTCSTCKDTHQMSVGERDVMCTRCPSPCMACGDAGPFCTKTPCPCPCHAKKPFRVYFRAGGHIQVWTYEEAESAVLRLREAMRSRDGGLEVAENG